MRLLPLEAMMTRLCVNKWRLSVKLRSKLPLNKKKNASGLSKKRVARRRRNRRSAVKRKSVSASLRRKPSVNVKRMPRLSKCSPCSSNSNRCRSSSAISSSSATVMSRTSS